MDRALFERFIAVYFSANFKFVRFTYPFLYTYRLL